MHPINSENHDHDSDSNNCLKKKKMNWNISAKHLRYINLQFDVGGTTVIDRFLQFHLWNRDYINPKFHFVKVVTTSLQRTLHLRYKFKKFHYDYFFFFVKRLKCRLIRPLTSFHYITNRVSCHICFGGWNCGSLMTLKHPCIIVIRNGKIVWKHGPS